MPGRIMKMFLCTVVVLCTTTVYAAPKQYQNTKQYYDDGTATAIRELRDSVDVLRHESKNRELEMKILEEMVTNQDSIIDSLRQQIASSTQTSKDLLKGNVTNTESKIDSLDKTIKGLVADLRQLKTHANETGTLLAEYTQKIAVLEKSLDIQNQNMGNMQIALQSAMEALNVKAGLGSSITTERTLTESANGEKIYRVRPGDSLEKIARSFQTTISMIKELNGLNNDRIIVGQKLKLP